MTVKGAAKRTCGGFAFLAAVSAVPAGVREEIGYTELVRQLGNRPSLPLVTYVARGAGGWNLRKGLSEPSPVPGQWRSPAFELDATWEEVTLPVGYGDDDDVTVLDDMRGGYQSVYLRKEFVLEQAPPDSLLVRLYVDDGAVIWINGTEVARRHVDDGTMSHDSSATIHEAAWERLLLTDAAAYLVQGVNVVAVHAINQSATSSDFSFDMELLSPRVTVAQMEAPLKIEVPAGSGNFEKYFLPQAFPETSQGEPEAGTAPSRGDTFAGLGDFANTRFRVESVSPSLRYSVSSHARTVGASLYGADTAAFPALPEVECYETGDWLDRVMGIGREPGSGATPGSGAGWIQNHSWIETLDEDSPIAEMEEALLRVDHAAIRDDVLTIVGLNNGAGTDVPPLMASAFNVISVGLTNGGHSRGGTIASFSQPGRQKPELVAPLPATSYATATVSSVAGFLLDETFRDLSRLGRATRPEVMKAILMAGATQDEFGQWSQTSEAPLDPVFGAGEVNLARSHRILTGASGEPGAGGFAALSGWKADDIPAGTTTTITLNIPTELVATRITAALCWNRLVENRSNNGGFNPEVSLADLSLTLTRAGAQENALRASKAPIGNVEFIVVDEPLASGDYQLHITADLSTRMGIAWIVDTQESGVVNPPTLPPQLRVVRQNDRFKVVLVNLVPGGSYRLEQSADLALWESVSEAVATASRLDWEVEQLPSNPVFFRLLMLEGGQAQPPASPPIVLPAPDTP